MGHDRGVEQGLGLIWFASLEAVSTDLCVTQREY